MKLYVSHKCKADGYRAGRTFLMANSEAKFIAYCQTLGRRDSKERLSKVSV
jgi:hypothetical protein